MAGNVFDQFDTVPQPSAATVPPLIKSAVQPAFGRAVDASTTAPPSVPVAAMPVAAGGAPHPASAQSSGNPFDSFDNGGTGPPAGWTPPPPSSAVAPPSDKTPVDAYRSEGYFAGEQPKTPATRFTPEQEHAFLAYAQTGANPQQMRDWAMRPENGGMHILNAEDVAKAVANPHARLNSNFDYHLPTPPPAPTDGPLAQTETGKALAGGVGDMISMGTANKLFAGLAAGGDVLGGKTQNFGDSYNRYLDRNNGQTAFDQANHPWARLSGELLGGLLINPEMAPVALEAGTQALRAGATMPMARAAAAKAAAMQQTKFGAVIGGLHGVGSADTLPDAAVGGISGTAVGALAGYGLTRAAQAAPGALDAVTNAVQRALPPATDWNAVANNLGVRATPATLGPVGRQVQKGFQQLPGSSSVVGNANAREASDLGAAAGRVADSLGTATNHEAAGTDVASGAAQWAKSQEDAATALYNNRNKLMGGDQTSIPTPLTAKALADLKTRYPNSPAMNDLMTHPAVRKIEAALPDAPTTTSSASSILQADGSPFVNSSTTSPPNLNLDEATTGLSYIRRAERRLDANPEVDPDLAKGVFNVKQALNADLRNAATKSDALNGRVADPTNPGATALGSHNQADITYSDMMGVVKRGGSLNRAISSADDPIKASSEGVYNQLSNDMLAKSGNLARLRDTFFRLPDNAKGSFASTKVNELGGGDNWSFNKFLTNWNAMAPQARNIVFGADADKSLQQIAQYAGRMQQTEKGRNFSNTASGMFSGAYNGAIIGSIMKGEPGEAAAIAATAPAFAGIAKLFVSTPAMRNWTVNTMRTLSNKAMPTAIREGALRAATGRLGMIAQQDPTIASQALGLQQHILSAANENFGLAATATPSNSVAPQVTSQPAGGQQQANQ